MKRPLLGLAIVALLIVACSGEVARSPTGEPVPPQAPLPQTAAVLASATPPGSGAPRYEGPGDYVDRVYVAGSPRLFKLHIPSGYQPGRTLPLVLVFHGAGQEIQYLEEMSQMSLKADEAGFVVVYPQAMQQVWNAEGGCLGAADVDFVRVLIEHLTSELSIDPARVYAAGFSSGGSMVHRLACDLSDRIAAVAPIAGAYFNKQSGACEPDRPVPVVAFHGTGDTHIAYQADSHDVPRWAADWANRNGCDPEPRLTFQQGDGTGETWGNCDANATVVLYTIEGGRHIWPGSPMAKQFFPDVQDIPATDLIWAFFQEHPIKP